MFEAYEMTMPVLLPRQLTQWLTEKNWTKISESPRSIEQWFSSYEDFVQLAKQDMQQEHDLLLSLVEQQRSTLKTIEAELQNKSTLPKGISKSVKTLRAELETLQRRIDAFAQEELETSSSYASYLKLHKKSFDSAKRFEREQFVVGQVKLFEESK